MSKPKSFQGVNVFMSRNLVPPEVFATLHDAVKDNGAQIHLCCDPSRNGPNDYHIISCSKHEKFEDLKSKGCKMLGPRCVLQCAKEGRPLPKQGFTCCFTMDGVKILASGFEMEEKVKIEELVTEMGGALHKPTSDLNFVIVKNVLAQKYKWALNVLKKPIVTYEWLKQCSDEHRVVPQESYKVLPFSGLRICVTGFPADKRKEMEKIILQNGGKYCAELTKKCTHLISDTPEGDKYKVAKRWGHIHIVTMKWFDQSVARRACLNEESYPVQSGSLSSRKVTRDLTAQHSQEKDIGKMQSGSSSRAADSNILVSDCAESMDIDPEATQSEHMSSVSNVPLFVKEADAEAHPLQTSNELNLDGAVANDSESDDNDLYLAECRISLVGFEASEMRKLVNMVRKGGGSRYMSLNDKLTHIVIGNPTEMEKKDVRSIAAQSVIFVVKTSWLEDCDRQKKQVPVLGRHTANDLVLPKVKGAVTGIVPMDQSKSSSFRQSFQTDKVVGINEFGAIMPESLEKNKQEKHDMGMNVVTFGKASGRTTLQTQLPDKKLRGQKMTQRDSNVHVKSTNVFKGKTFCFSNFFPEERRAEIVQWISQGGGEIISGQTKQSIHYTIECHGKPKSTGDYGSTYISSHWIRSCLEDGSLLDVDSHILYSPLPCRVPLPGFENLRFCVSQYEEKDRILLWNLCKVLGAKFADKLTKKVTHLLCKFTNGPKYEASCKWGIRSVTSEWIFECVKQNGVIAVDQFLPKEVTTQDREAGACTVSQFPTQAVQMINDMPSQFPSQSQSLRHTANKNVDNHRTHSKISSINSKKARLMEEPSLYNKVPSTVNSGIHVSDMNFSKANMLKDAHEAVQMINDTPPQFPSQLQSMRNMADKNVDSGDANHGTHSKISSINSIKSGLVEEPGMYNKAPSTVNLGIHVSDLNFSEDNMLKDDREATHAVPDVAAAIEDLLEQTSKMHDQRSPGNTGCERSIYTSDCPVIGEDKPNPRTVFGLSKHWLNRIGSNDDNGETSKERKVGMYDAFSETQTESQIVGYEEDLSGRQMLIDRVLTRSSMQ